MDYLILGFNVVVCAVCWFVLRMLKDVTSSNERLIKALNKENDMLAKIVDGLYKKNKGE